MEKQATGVAVFFNGASPEFIDGATSWGWDTAGNTAILNVYNATNQVASFCNPAGVKLNYSTNRSSSYEGTKSRPKSSLS